MCPSSSRRAFLTQLLLGSDSAAPRPGEVTLVCIFLRGGADTLNMIVPHGDPSYYASRATIAIPPPKGSGSECAIKLDDLYGFHPKMKPLLPAFHEGRLAAVQAVGSDNATGSHFEAQDQMERGESCGCTIGGGWLGRHLSSRSRVSTTPLSAVAIGSTIPESLRGAPTASALTCIEDLRLTTPSGHPEQAAQALAALYNSDVSILSEPGSATLKLLKRVESLRNFDAHHLGSRAAYPSTALGKALREVANLILAEVGLEAACVDFGNWDTHFVQGGVSGLQANNIEELSQALAAFDLDTHRCERVITIVMTEFGRRTYENGSLGTDHGRGFAFFAMGKHVNGGRVHGDWPGLKRQELDVLGPSGLLIRHDYRSVLSEILIGSLGNHKIEKVFPGFQPKPVGLIDMRPAQRARA